MLYGGSVIAESLGDGVSQKQMDPHLWAAARRNPQGKLTVIVQMHDLAPRPAQVAAAHGGRLHDEFPFVRGFRMDLPAAALARLSKAPGVRYISLDAPLNLHAVDTAYLQTVYNQAAGSSPLWNNSLGLTGRGVGVAVLDTGVQPHADLKDRLTVVRSNPKALHGGDANGHGTHVAGIIAGRAASGRYIGVAPEARIIGIKIADDQGISSEGDLLRGLQWVFENHAKYNIRVVNVSVSGSLEMSYRNSAIDAGVEQLWRAGLVVVAASSNRGDAANAVNFAPANDPFVITVGALDDGGTADSFDDSLAFFSSRGTTQDGFSKPEIVAPGRRMVSLLAGKSVTLAQRFPERVLEEGYLRLSGTSMSAPVVAGAAALLLQQYPNLTPDQVKWALVTSARAYPGQPAGTAPALDIQAAVNLIASQAPGAANQGLEWNAGMDTSTGTVKWSTTYWETTYWESAYTENADYVYTDFD